MGTSNKNWYDGQSYRGDLSANGGQVFWYDGQPLESVASSVAASIDVSGVAASPGVGSLSVTISSLITGVAASAAIGALAVAISSNVALSGVVAAAAVGSVANATVDLVGVGAHALVQAPTVIFDSIRGVAAAPAVGTLTAGGGTSVVPALMGVLASAGVGSLTVSYGSVAGVAAAPGIGTLTFAASASVPISGVTAFSATGQPVGEVTVSYATVLGVAAAPGLGTLGITGTARASLAGVAASSAVGSLLGVNTRFALFINGVDRTRMLHADSMSGNRELTGQASCTFTLYDRRGRYVPQWRDEVVYLYLGRKIFGGLVQKTETRCLECRTETMTTVMCVGYQQIAQDRTYTNTFRGPSIDLATVVQGIVSTGLAGESLTYDAAETSSIAGLRFILPGDSVDGCLRKVATTWGYNYWVDDDARIRMERSRWDLAPYVIRDQASQAGAVWRNMKITRDATQYRNSQGIRGTIPLSQPTESDTGEVVMTEDAAEIARRGATVESVTTVRNVVDLAAAQALAESLKAKHGAPITEVEFESDLPYWQVGQIAHVFTTSPAVAGMFQVRSIGWREIGLTFLRYAIVLQAPELPAVVGIDVTDNGDGSRIIDYSFDRDLNLGPGEPFTFTGTGEPNTPGFGPFGEKGANVLAMAASFVADHWEVIVTLEEWLGTLPGEAIRLQGCEIEATGGHGLSYGDPVGSINATWSVHAIDRDAKQFTIRTGLDGNKVVDFSGLHYTNSPDGLCFGAQKQGGLDGSWITNGSDGNTLSVYSGQLLHIQSIALTAGVDENSWTVRLNVDHVPKFVFPTGATAPMLAGDTVSVNGLESTTPLRPSTEPDPVRAALIADVYANGLNGRWVSSAIGVDPEKWIEFKTNFSGNKKLILTGFVYTNAPDATAYLSDTSVNPPIDVPAGTINTPGGGGFTGIPAVPGESANNTGIGASDGVFRVVGVNNLTGEVTVDRDHNFTTSYPETPSGSVVTIACVTAPEGINNPVCRITVTGARTFIAEDSFDTALAFEPAFKNDGFGFVVLTDQRVRVNLASGPHDALAHALGLTAGNIPLVTEKATFFLPNGVPGIPSRGLVVGDDVTSGWTAQKDIAIVDSVYITMGIPGMGDEGVDGSGDIQIDVTKNGTSIFAGGSATIAGGSTDPVTVRDLAENPTYVMQGDKLNVSVKKTGSQFPGCNAQVVVNMKG